MEITIGWVKYGEDLGRFGEFWEIRKFFNWKVWYYLIFIDSTDLIGHFSLCPVYILKLIVYSIVIDGKTL